MARISKPKQQEVKDYCAFSFESCHFFNFVYFLTAKWKSVDSSESDDNEMGENSSSSVTPGDGLTRLITLQSAEGYWVLNEPLATILGRPLSSLKGSCPSGCPEVVWGTLLALALLETKYSSQRDEWELVSMKTEMWLQSQTPQGTTVASLTAQAKQALA